MVTRREFLILFALGALCSSPASAADDEANAFFEAKVRPILVARCQQCHGDREKPKAGLKLTSRAAILGGGESGPAAVAGDAKQSRLVEVLQYAEEPRMPPKGKLPDDEIATLTRWVAIGMPWPDAAATVVENPGSTFKIRDDQRRFWSFQPVRQAAPPAVQDPTWPLNPIDRFVLAGLEKRGLGPAPEARRETLLRRVSFDLTGLPPTPEQVLAFLADASPLAYENAVDRLLASPAYGERWGRHWLDVARYADSRDARGVGGGDDIADAWRYRDWVVAAFNRDLPYDQFILEQIAGDQLPGPDPSDINPEGLVATGLLAIGEWGTGDADKEKMLTDVVADQIDVVTRGFLGLTVACARCHDHKFDPISQADYYALAGIFFSTRILPDPGVKTAGSPMLRTPIAPRAHREALARYQRNLAEANVAVAEAERQARDTAARALLPRLGDVLRAAVGEKPAGEVPSHASKAFAELLGVGDDSRTLAKKLSDVGGNKGVDFWASQPDPPWVGVNASEEPARITTLTLPPRSLNLHPGPKTAAGIRWKSPLAGLVKVEASLADADPNGGNGVNWAISVRHAGAARPLASGELDNGSSTRLAGEKLDRVAIELGDVIELVVGPRGEYSFDTTTVTFRVETLDTPAETWDATADLLPQLFAGNPHADARGHKGTWELVEAGRGSVTRPIADHPAWLAWDRAMAAGSDRNEAIADFVRAVELDARLAQALTIDRGPLRPPAGDEQALSQADRDLIASRGQAVAGLKATAPPPIPTTLAALEGGVPKSAYEGIHDARIQIRGDYRRLGPVVPRRVPEIIAGEHAPTISSGSGRLELARWVASRENPLTARVMVNRLWQGHFGWGLVRTPGNFGKLGEPPTDPALLDWLAAEFMNEGWSLKALHRLMVTSRTYRQGTTAPEATLKLDPDNRLFGRMERRRLEAEAVRDALLAAAGKLDLAQQGPATRDFNSTRRTLYQMTIRSDRSSFGPLFDAADSTAIVDRRALSTVAPQALFLLNHPFAVDQAQALAKRLRELPAEDAGRVEQAYLRLYGRRPTADELAIARDFLGDGGEAAWEAYAQVLLCANEFLYVD